MSLATIARGRARSRLRPRPLQPAHLPSDSPPGRYAPVLLVRAAERALGAVLTGPTEPARTAPCAHSRPALGCRCCPLVRRGDRATPRRGPHIGARPAAT